MRTFILTALAVGTLASTAVAQASPPTAAGHCSAACHHRVKQRMLRQHRAARARRWHNVADPYWGIFSAIETCERGAAGWQTDTGNGFFGGLQFALRSWYGVGGTGNPAHASMLEQIYRAVLLMRQQGYGAWPVCRRVAGV